MKKKYQISYLCWLLNVSKSGYYKWIKNGMNEFNKWDTFLANIIKNIFYEFQEIYGYKMITLWINKIYNLKLKFHIVYRYMKNMSLKAKVRIKKFDYRTKSGSLRTCLESF
ncbi:IS3 family transposase [Spiroplasma ixodetis]|uniref:IS3 family transposase n=1 Tax=Spiroplasma ixodetis TaxID=2141 RepID=UPI002492E0C6|nr:IS3 family transposase [Spiroplasma ixodetis]